MDIGEQSRNNNIIRRAIYCAVEQLYLTSIHVACGSKYATFTFDVRFSNGAASAIAMLDLRIMQLSLHCHLRPPVPSVALVF